MSKVGYDQSCTTKDQCNDPNLKCAGPDGAKKCSWGASGQLCDTNSDCNAVPGLVCDVPNHRCVPAPAPQAPAPAAAAPTPSSPAEVAINLAGKDRCSVAGLGKDTSATYLVTMDKAACAKLGGLYNESKQACDLVSCAPDTTNKACTGEGDAYHPTLSIKDVATPLEKVCIRATKNPRRIHVTRPDLLGSASNCAADDVEGEVLIGMSADECTKFGAADNYTADQCRLSARYVNVGEADAGKCASTFMEKPTVERRGTVAGLTEKTCIESGGTYDAAKKTCSDVTYCAVEGVDVNVCEPGFEGWVRDWGGWGVGMVIAMLVGIVVLVIAVMVLSGKGGVAGVISGETARADFLAHQLNESRRNLDTLKKQFSGAINVLE